MTALITGGGVAHTFEKNSPRTSCGQMVKHSYRKFERTRDCVNVEDVRVCKSCFPAWRAKN